MLYVIFTNDAPRFVCHTEEEVPAKIEELAWAEWKILHWQFKDYEDYRKRYYWHYHEVPSNPTLSQKERSVLLDFLEDYSGVLSRRICNDWNFPDDWTTEERENFCRAYHEWNGDPGEYDPKHLHLPDGAVVDFLAFKLKELA